MSYYPNVYASQTGPLLLSGLDANFNFAVDIQSQSLYASAGGSSDIITATLTPAVTSLISGLTLYIRAATANTTTTPTFSPNSLTAKTIVKANNIALAVGDIAGSGHILILQYDATNGVWELANPATANTSFPGGTANGVLYLNGSKIATSGAALTFDGTNFATTGTASAAKLIPTGSSATGNGMYLPATNAVGISTNGTNAVYIDASQNLLVGATTANYSGSGFTLSKDSGTTKWLCGPNAGNPTQFIISAATSLGVYLTSTSATSWSSASDERLKDIIEPIADGIEKVCTLRSVIGTYKNDPEKNRRPFLIAQDLQKVFPEAVDASDPDRLGVQYTEVIPLLVAAIKEQQALITQLTDRIAALEAK